MEIIAGGLNGMYLRNILERSIGPTTCVKAAIAYASGDPELFDRCIKNNIKLEFWGRYDASVPVASVVLKKFLDKRSPNFVCRLVPDRLHAKVIWWQGLGVYIGSANLTENGWYGNIELGVFLREDEIIENDLFDELTNFFEELDSRSYPLTKEIYEESCHYENKYTQSKRVVEDRFNKDRKLPRLEPLTRISRKSGLEKKKGNLSQGMVGHSSDS